MKNCFKCGKKKKLINFYKHSGMADGYLNKCKECTQLDAMRNRYKKLDYYKEYDRKRAMIPHRVAVRNEYQKTEACKHSNMLSKARWTLKNPDKRKAVCHKYNMANKLKRRAQGAVARAIDSGKLIRLPCRVCDNIKSHGHHENYSKPLDVIWLCAQCHKDKHKGNDNACHRLQS